MEVTSKLNVKRGRGGTRLRYMQITVKILTVKWAMQLTYVWLERLTHKLVDFKSTSKFARENNHRLISLTQNEMKNVHKIFLKSCCHFPTPPRC